MHRPRTVFAVLVLIVMSVLCGTVVSLLAIVGRKAARHQVLDVHRQMQAQFLVPIAIAPGPAEQSFPEHHTGRITRATARASASHRVASVASWRLPFAVSL